MNSFQLTSGNSFCNLEIKRGTPIHAGPSLGAYLLHIPITFKVHTSTKTRILTSVMGELHLNSQFITELRPSYWGGNVQSSDKNSLEFQINFHSVFTKSNIDAIETVRNEIGLQFDIHLFGDIFDLSPDEKSSPGILHTYGDLSHRMHQSEWIEILNIWKYAPAMNFAIVFKFESPALTKAGEFIYHAQKFYLERQWPQVVSECRKAIDVASELLNTNNLSLKSLIENKHENKMRERLILSLLSIKQVCDPASHGDANSIKISWTQEDALYVIRMTASILARVSKEVV